jgi:formate hydrogenlyase subunit 4
MKTLFVSIYLVFAIVGLPVLALFLLRKTKAILQNRIGPPILQPLYDLIKTIRKHEVVSKDASYLFRLSAFLVFSITILILFVVPWLPLKPNLFHSDLFLIIYLFGLLRFFAIIGGLDGGSPFGAFGTSREAILAALTEPAIMLALVAVAFTAKTTNIDAALTQGDWHQFNHLPVWLLAAISLYLASLVELSRMPIDDPNTHLELTMVHEAMLIEYSGLPLALIQAAYALRLLILFGLISQFLIHALAIILPVSLLTTAILTVVLISTLAIITAIIESFTVKLAWRKNPEFIALTLSFSFFASLSTLVEGLSL